MILRRCCCASAVPMAPGDTPITAAGLPARALCPYGRDAWSMAFLRTPGMTVVFRCHEDDAVRRRDLGFKLLDLRRWIIVVVLIVGGQVADPQLSKIELRWRQLGGLPGQLAVEGVPAGGYRRSPRSRMCSCLILR